MALRKPRTFLPSESYQVYRKRNDAAAGFKIDRSVSGQGDDMITDEVKRVFGKRGKVSGLKQMRQIITWELRRLRVSQTSWKMAGGALFLFSAILFLRNSWGLGGPARLVGSTAHGQLAELVYDLMLVFGMILAFVATDSVARDYKQRMHELLMTTAVPAWVYVWGRYLASLVMGLGLAITLLIAQFGMNLLLSSTTPSYPSPGLAAGLAFWGVLVVPATVVVCSLGFALGTLFPRYTIVPKVAICIAWVILALDTDIRDLGWRDYWNPTGAGMAKLLILQLTQAVQSALQTVSSQAQQADLILRLQQQPPNLWPWVGPYLTLAGLGLLLVAGTALGFRRFREVLG